MALQVDFVRAPLPTDQPGVCEVCHGATLDSRAERCYACVQTAQAAQGPLADVVVPISYRFKDDQHAHDLMMYKKADTAGTAESRKRLAALFWDFCQRHITCVKVAAGVASFTHVCFVPSTKTPDAEHPLQRLLAPAIPLPRIALNVNRAIQERAFDPTWFDAQAEDLGDGGSAAVLLIDDTWVSGARMQSAAHSLKLAGARRVACLVLARQLNPGFAPAGPLIQRAQKARFDPESCVRHQ